MCALVLDGFVYIWGFCMHLFEISACVCMFLFMCVFSRLHVNMQGRTWDDTVNLSTKHSSYFLLLISCSLVFMGLFTCNTVKYIYNIWPKGHSYCFGLEWVWFILIVWKLNHPDHQRIPEALHILFTFILMFLDKVPYNAVIYRMAMCAKCLKV